MVDKPSKKVAIIQSCYIPWKGFFDLIAAADEFIFYDDAQYTKNSWRNRNKIKTSQGAIWLTVPVKITGKFGQTIREAEIIDNDWSKNHWKTLCLNYKNAPYFNLIAPLLEPFYTSMPFTHISEMNRQLTQTLCDFLEIKTKLTCSWDYTLSTGKTEKVVNLCTQAGATEYISGPSAKDYIVEDMFTAAGIKLTWFDYAGYPEYPQLWGDFVHEVSIVDLLFNCGKNAKKYMKYGSPHD